MFEEAKVVSPDRKITISTALSNTTSTGKYWLGRKTSGSTASTGSHPTEAYDCEICFLSLPKSVWYLISNNAPLTGIYIATMKLTTKKYTLFVLYIVTLNLLDDDWLGMWTPILHQLLDRISYDENCRWRGQSNDWMSGKINMHTTLDRIHCFGNKWRLEILLCDK